MERSTENTTMFLQRLVLVIALAFLCCMASNDDHSYNHSYPTNIQVVTEEISNNSLAIPIVASTLPSIQWSLIIDCFKTNPIILSEVSCDLNITEKLHQCILSYFITKPLVLKTMQYQMLPRRPDPSLLS